MAGKTADLLLDAEEIVFSQSFGTRRECREWLRQGLVHISWPETPERPLKPDEKANPQGATLRLGNLSLPWVKELRLMLHKPAGYECSHRPSHHLSVFDLLPAPFVRRSIQAAGRLDADTTGLLLLGTDGQWLHNLASPRRKMTKVYRVTHDGALSDESLRLLCEGVHIYGENGRKGDMVLTEPALAERLDARTARLAITEGKYHQVKRMFAALGMKVTALHRECVGEYRLPEDLLPGQWRILD